MGRKPTGRLRPLTRTLVINYAVSDLDQPVCVFNHLTRGTIRAKAPGMLGNMNYMDESKSGDLGGLIPAVAIIVMTVASWVGMFTVFNQVAQHAPSVQVTSDIIYDSAAGR